MVAQAQFSETGLVLAPGDEGHVRLTVVNLGDGHEAYSLLPSGFAAGWVRFDPMTIALAPRSSREVKVTIAPPRVPSTTAGAAVVTARAVAHGDPEDVATADLAVNIQVYDDRRVHLLQPVQRTRRSATYEVVVENRGNGHASCRMHLSDPTGRIDGGFDPPSVGVDPGGSALARLKVRVLRRRWRRAPRFLSFGIEAAQQGHDTAYATGSLLQVPAVHSSALGWVVAAALAAGAAVAGWSGLVRPAIEDAAATAVQERIDEVVPASVPTGAVPLPTAGGSVSAPAVTEPGELFATRLQADVALGATSAGTYNVPAGHVLRITDVILQNPGQDIGRAVLTRNGQTLFEWSLGTVYGSESLPIVTPMEFPAGDEVSFAVTCEGFNDLARGACSPSMTLIGRLLRV